MILLSYGLVVEVCATPLFIALSMLATLPATRFGTLCYKVWVGSFFPRHRLQQSKGSE